MYIVYIQFYIHPTLLSLSPKDPAFGARMARQELLLARSSSADRSRGGVGVGGGMFEFSSDDDAENEIDATSPAGAARIIGTRLGRQRGEYSPPIICP